MSSEESASCEKIRRAVLEVAREVDTAGWDDETGSLNAPAEDCEDPTWLERCRFFEDAASVPLHRARIEEAELAAVKSRSEEGAIAVELVDNISVEDGCAGGAFLP